LKTLSDGFRTDGAELICERILEVTDVFKWRKASVKYYDLSVLRSWICRLSRSWCFYGNGESCNTPRIKQRFLSHLFYLQSASIFSDIYNPPVSVFLGFFLFFQTACSS